MPVKKILIVDDSPTERLALTELLHKHGYQVFTSESGDEGVAKAKEIRPDLILMDVVMPGTNGFQATWQSPVMKQPKIFRSFCVLPKIRKPTRFGECAKGRWIT